MLELYPSNVGWTRGSEVLPPAGRMAPNGAAVASSVGGRGRPAGSHRGRDRHGDAGAAQDIAELGDLHRLEDEVQQELIDENAELIDERLFR